MEKGEWKRRNVPGSNEEDEDIMNILKTTSLKLHI